MKNLKDCISHKKLLIGNFTVNNEEYKAISDFANFYQMKITQFVRMATLSFIDSKMTGRMVTRNNLTVKSI